MKMQRNQDLRKQIKENDIFLYQISEELKIHESTLYRLLRRDLSDHEKSSILQAIKKLKEN